MAPTRRHTHQNPNFPKAALVWVTLSHDFTLNYDLRVVLLHFRCFYIMIKTFASNDELSFDSCMDDFLYILAEAEVFVEAELVMGSPRGPNAFRYLCMRRTLGSMTFVNFGIRKYIANIYSERLVLSPHRVRIILACISTGPATPIARQARNYTRSSITHHCYLHHPSLPSPLLGLLSR